MAADAGGAVTMPPESPMLRPSPHSAADEDRDAILAVLATPSLIAVVYPPIVDLT